METTNLGPNPAGLVGTCPACQHLNERRWVLCDACDARLPWAPPERPARMFSELTNEELHALYTDPVPHRPCLMLTLDGFRLWGWLMLGLAVLWWFIRGGGW